MEKLFNENRIRLASYLLAGIGLVDSIYLTWVKLGSTTPLMCAPGGGCDIVNSSPYSEVLGIPVALLGALTYISLIGILALESRSAYFKTNGILLLFGTSLIGVLYSAYLTYLELAVIHAICPYCVVSAVVISLFFILQIIRLVKFQPTEDYASFGGK